MSAFTQNGFGHGDCYEICHPTRITNTRWICFFCVILYSSHSLRNINALDATKKEGSFAFDFRHAIRLASFFLSFDIENLGPRFRSSRLYNPFALVSELTLLAVFTCFICPPFSSQKEDYLPSSLIFSCLASRYSLHSIS